jgi:hypothetical protein
MRADSPDVRFDVSCMRRAIAVALWAFLAGISPLAAQDSPTWLSGDWTELTKTKGKRKGADEPSGTLRVEVAGGALRILENGADGEDLRCRLDGTESVYRHTKKQATLDYMLQCEVGQQYVELTGLFTAGGIQGFPPREFELRKKYELAPDGSLRKQDQLWGIIPGLGRVAVSDSTTSFSKKR